MEKINWINGQAGGTPLSAENLNQMQDNIEEAINEVDEKMQETVLYSNETGTTGNINLSDSVANYNYIEIQCRRTGFIYTSGKIYNANGKTIVLTSSNATDDHIYLYTKVVQINGDTITAVKAKLMYLNSQMQAFATDNDNYITRVVGYKL